MSKKKVITVSGDNSKWYDKVIFVVKKEHMKENMPIDFVLEAENIISNYMLSNNMAVGKFYPSKNNNSNVTSRSKINGIDMFLYSSIVICILLVSIMLLESF